MYHRKGEPFWRTPKSTRSRRASEKADSAAFLCILPLENLRFLLYTILCIIKTEQKQSEKVLGKYGGES